MSQALTIKHNPGWTLLAPGIAWLVLAIYWILPSIPGMVMLLCLALVGSVVSAVHHAEVIAHKVGEPFGTLVLALSVTVIEVALIVSTMMSAGESSMGLARDTIFAAVMIILNGIIGASLLVGGYKHMVQGFNLEGVTAALGTMTVIVTFAMIIPNFSTSLPGPVYSSSQLIFVSIITLMLFAAFTLFQTGKHREYFLPVPVKNEAAATDEIHAPPPSQKETLVSLGALLVSLVAVVLCAKGISPSLQALLNTYNAPAATLGILIAAIVLLPEFGAAMRAALNNRLQASLNLAIDSAIASIGLTIPAVAIVALMFGWQLELGLDAKSICLLVMSLFVVSNSLRTGNTTTLPGVVHLIIFAAYLFLSFVP